MNSESVMVSKALLAAAGFFLSVGAQAATGASLLTTKHTSQLQTWLGEGAVALNAIYTKQAGDTALDFHKAADGKGRTFSVMEASNTSGQTWLIGGYNPQSWSSTDGMHVTMADSERTGFLFNLTSGLMLPQLKQYFNGDGIGKDQTYNDANYGPTFGFGHDLYVPYDLTNGGYSLLYTYNFQGQPQVGYSVLDGAVYKNADITYGAMQVFTISAVPEPATYGLLLSGLALLGWRAQRKSMKAQPAM